MARRLGLHGPGRDPELPLGRPSARCAVTAGHGTNPKARWTRSSARFSAASGLRAEPYVLRHLGARADRTGLRAVPWVAVRHAAGAISAVARAGDAGDRAAHAFLSDAGDHAPGPRHRFRAAGWLGRPHTILDLSWRVLGERADQTRAGPCAGVPAAAEQENVTGRRGRSRP